MDMGTEWALFGYLGGGILLDVSWYFSPGQRIERQIESAPRMQVRELREATLTST